MNVDLVLLNAHVHTVDPDRPRAQALAVACEVIVAIGSNADVRHLAGAGTQVIDAGGRLVVPGMFTVEAGHVVVLNRRDPRRQRDGRRLTPTSSSAPMTRCTCASLKVAEGREH